MEWGTIFETLPRTLPRRVARRVCGQDFDPFLELHRIPFEQRVEEFPTPFRPTFREPLQLVGDDGSQDARRGGLVRLDEGLRHVGGADQSVVLHP